MSESPGKELKEEQRGSSVRKCTAGLDSVRLTKQVCLFVNKEQGKTE